MYAERTTGAEDDMQQITNLARQMVTRWGMSDEVGPVTLAPRESPFLVSPAGYMTEGARSYSEQTAELIDSEVQRILRQCYAEAKRLLLEHRSALDALARALLDKETLDEAEIREVTGLTSDTPRHGLPVPVARAAFQRAHRS